MCGQHSGRRSACDADRTMRAGQMALRTRTVAAYRCDPRTRHVAI